LKFLDEAGSNLAMTRFYGRAPKGARVIETVPPQLRREYDNVGKAFDGRH